MEKMNEKQKQLVMDNLKLVHYVIHRKFPQYTVGSDAYRELEQEGYLGLCKAAAYYNAEISQFSTYAINWIWGYIKKYIDTKTGWAFHLRSSDRSHYEHINYGSLNVETIEGHGVVHELFEIVPDKTNAYNEIVFLNDALLAFEEANHTCGEDIFRLLNEGFIQQEIADYLGTTQSWVSRIIKKAKHIYDSSTGQKGD